MINISELSLNFSGEPLFKDVNLKFTQGNCYGVIGANGAGKSTFLRILSGDLDPSTGTVSIAPKTRMSVLKQDHFAFNDETVLNTVLGGNERLLAVMREKDALYMKDPFTEEDGNKAAELEAEFAEMGGWGRRDRDQPAAQRPRTGCGRHSVHRDEEPRRRREGQGPARPRAVRQAGHPAARRADQPSGYSGDPLARGFSCGLRGHRPRCIA